MKILIDCYDTISQNDSGGVQIRVNKIYDLLKKKNINVKLFNKFEDKIDDYDILHIFKLEYQKFPLIECAKIKGKVVVISTIVSTKVNWKFYLYKLIAKLKFTSIYKLNEKMLNLADFLICETPKEKEFFVNYYKVNKDKIYVIPNGADAKIYNGNEIYEIVDKNKKYLLQVGVFDENKNQLNVIKAVKNTNIELVLIGGAYFSSKEYYDKCLEEAKGCKNIHFLGWLDHDSNLFKSAYSHADTLILPSYSETFGLVAIEGVMYGTKLVLSNTISLLSYDEFNTIKTFSPNNINEIRSSIESTMNLKKDDIVYDKIKKRFSWDEVIDEHIRLYRRATNEEKNKSVIK